MLRESNLLANNITRFHEFFFENNFRIKLINIFLQLCEIKYKESWETWFHDFECFTIKVSKGFLQFEPLVVLLTSKKFSTHFVAKENWHLIMQITRTISQFSTRKRCRSAFRRPLMSYSINVSIRWKPAYFSGHF